MQSKPVDLSQSPLPPGVFPQKKPDSAKPPAPAATPPAAAAPESQPAPAKSVCRKCGADPAADPDQINPEDLVAFTKSVWKDEPFTKTYRLFGDAVKVTFRSITADEIEATQRTVIAEASKSDQSVGILGMFSLGERGEELQLACSIENLSIGDRSYQRPATRKPPLDTLADIRAVTGGNVAYQAIRTVWREFYSLVQRLIAAGSNPSFWGATRSSGQSQSSPTTATQS